MTKPSISNHLSILKQADLVESEKIGQNVIYSFKTSVLEDMLIIAKRTRKRLISTSCKNFDDFGQYHPEEHTQKQYEKIYFVNYIID